MAFCWPNLFLHSNVSEVENHPRNLEDTDIRFPPCGETSAVQLVQKVSPDKHNQRFTSKRAQYSRYSWIQIKEQNAIMHLKLAADKYFLFRHTEAYSTPRNNVGLHASNLQIRQ